MTRSTFNNSGFQALALLDLTFPTSTKSVCIHTHTLTICTQICRKSQRHRQTPNKLQKERLSSSQRQCLEMAYNMSCKWMYCMVQEKVCFIHFKISVKNLSLRLVCWVTSLYGSTSSCKALLSIIIQEFSLNVTLQIRNTLPMSLTSTLLSTVNATVAAEYKNALS